MYHHLNFFMSFLVGHHCLVCHFVQNNDHWHLLSLHYSINICSSLFIHFHLHWICQIQWQTVFSWKAISWEFTTWFCHMDNSDYHLADPRHPLLLLLAEMSMLWSIFSWKAASQEFTAGFCHGSELFFTTQVDFYYYHLPTFIDMSIFSKAL